MYSIIKTIYINRKINIGVPEKRKLFGERRNDEMSELMTFSLSNKKVVTNDMKSVTTMAQMWGFEPQKPR
mgnify:CR=1 FL=1